MALPAFLLNPASWLTIAQLVQQLVGWLAKSKKTLDRDHAWTPEERAQVDVIWSDIMNDPALRTADEEED